MKKTSAPSSPASLEPQRKQTRRRSIQGTHMQPEGYVEETTGSLQHLTSFAAAKSTQYAFCVTFFAIIHRLRHLSFPRQEIQNRKPPGTVYGRLCPPRWINQAVFYLEILHDGNARADRFKSRPHFSNLDNWIAIMEPVNDSRIDKCNIDGAQVRIIGLRRRFKLKTTPTRNNLPEVEICEITVRQPPWMAVIFTG